ncbi:Uncharacterised protein [Vibrio cholerae]|nr:Uncharacterised protein [Vibrio cholerae]
MTTKINFTIQCKPTNVKPSVDVSNERSHRLSNFTGYLM